MKKRNIILAAVFAVALAPFALAEEVAGVPAEIVRSVPAKRIAKSVPATKKTSTPAGWTDNFPAAKKRAAAEGKDLFIAFSGSDWCGWCMRLHDEVFSQDGFLEKLSEKFVPVFIDLPQDENLLSAGAKKQNRKLAQKYRVAGFPTVLLADADGDVFAQTGYAEGGAEKYLEMIAKISDEGKNSSEYLARKALARVPANGADRVKKLDEILASLPPEAQISNANFVEEILAADPAGKLGYRAKYPYFTVVLPLEKQLQNAFKTLTARAQAEIEKAGQPPQTREEEKALLDKVFSENSGEISALQPKIEAAKKGFSESSFCRKKLDEMSAIIAQMFAFYGNDPAEKSPDSAK